MRQLRSPHPWHEAKSHMGWLGPASPLAQGQAVKVGGLAQGTFVKTKTPEPARLLGIPTLGGIMKPLVHTLVHRAISGQQAQSGPEIQEAP